MIRDIDSTTDERAPALFEPDTLLASQYFDRVRRRLDLSGEKMLMVAVLEDAVHTYLKYAGAHDARQRELFTEAAEWIESEDTTWLFSFESICGLLGLESDYIRRGLRARREATRHHTRGAEPVIAVRAPGEGFRSASGA